LFGHQASPGGKLPTVFEHLRITYSRNERRGCQRPNPRHSQQALADRVRVGEQLALLLVVHSFRFQSAEFVKELVEQLLAHGCQFRLFGFERTHQRLAELRQPLGQHPAILRQEPPPLIDEGRACGHQPLAHPVERLDFLLGHIFHRYKAHAGARQRFGDGFRTRISFVFDLTEGLTYGGAISVT
jgi:hypothetical protein